MGDYFYENVTWINYAALYCKGLSERLLTHDVFIHILTFVENTGIFKATKLANSVAKRSNSMTKLRRSGSMDFGNASMANVLDVAKALCLACKQRSKPKRSFSLFQIKVGLFFQFHRLAHCKNVTMLIVKMSHHNLLFVEIWIFIHTRFSEQTALPFTIWHIKCLDLIVSIWSI